MLRRRRWRDRRGDLGERRAAEFAELRGGVARTAASGANADRGFRRWRAAEIDDARRSDRSLRWERWESLRSERLRYRRRRVRRDAERRRLRRHRKRRRRAPFERLAARHAEAQAALVFAAARRAARVLRCGSGPRHESELGRRRSHRRRGDGRNRRARRRGERHRFRRRRSERGLRKSDRRCRRRHARRESLPAFFAEGEVTRVVAPARAADHATGWDISARPVVNSLRSLNSIAKADRAPRAPARSRTCARCLGRACARSRRRSARGKAADTRS